MPCKLDIAVRLAKAGQQPQSLTCNEDLVGEVGKTRAGEVVMSATNSYSSRSSPSPVSTERDHLRMRPALSKGNSRKGGLEACHRRVAGARRLGVVRSDWKARSARPRQCDVDTGESKCGATAE